MSLITIIPKVMDTFLKLYRYCKEKHYLFLNSTKLFLQLIFLAKKES